MQRNHCYVMLAGLYCIDNTQIKELLSSTQIRARTILAVAYLGVIFRGLEVWRARVARAYVGVWGLCYQWGPVGQSSWWGGQGAKPPEAESIFVLKIVKLAAY